MLINKARHPMYQCIYVLTQLVKNYILPLISHMTTVT